MFRKDSWREMRPALCAEDNSAVSVAARIFPATVTVEGLASGKPRGSGDTTAGTSEEMQPCPPEMEMRLPPPPPNYSHVAIGGNLVLLNWVNFQIADVFRVEIK